MLAIPMMSESATAFEPSEPAPWGCRLALGAAMLAAWAAAGSLGLMAVALQHALVWLCLAVAVVAVWPFRPATAQDTTVLRLTGAQWALICAVLLLIALHQWLPGVGDVFGVALILAALSGTQADRAGRVLHAAALAVAGFALYRYAYQSVPVVWHLADLIGQGLGLLVGTVTMRPLRVGVTFAGVDFLVLSAALCGIWIAGRPRPTLRRAALAVGAIAVGHLVFLTVLSFAPQIVARLPVAPPLPEAELEQTPLWFWGDAVRALLPWGLPLLAGAVHSCVVVLALPWCGVSAVGFPPTTTPPSKTEWGILVLLALLVPLQGTLAPFRADLSGRTIGVFQRGLFDWDRPVFDRYGDDAAGTLGMLPDLIESLHGRLVRVTGLSPAELERIDALVLFHPIRPWSEELLRQVWAYVERGGSLLVVAENRSQQADAVSAFDEVLAATSIRVRDDAARSANTDWEDCLQTAGCAAVVREPAALNPFGFEAGASSLTLGWSASPLVIGRYGWSVPGASGAERYQGGTRLGDLVLAAQQRVGDGRVVVLGDTNPFSNLGSVSAYLFTGRLLSWMAARGADPQQGLRQALTLVGTLILVGVVVRGGLSRLSLATLLFLASFALSTAINVRCAQLLPTGRPDSGGANRLAYIDASHLDAHAGASWADEGINGLALNLMRNGRLPLLLPQFDAARLDRAGMLVSIAPGRPFSPDERGVLYRWVDRGGIWVCMVGAEQAQMVAPLLEDFQFRVPQVPVPLDEAELETEPGGALFATYYESEQGQADVRLREAWPIECEATNATAQIRNSKEEPLCITRPIGRGMVAVVGDAKFALNVNLEQADGQPVDEGYHNSHFWRWFCGVLQRQTPWIPPLEKPEEPETSEKPKPPSGTPHAGPARPGNAELPNSLRSGTKKSKAAAGKEARP